MLDDHEFLVLNAVYLKKMADASAVADVLAMPKTDVDAVLAKATTDGLALDLDGQIMLDSPGSDAVLEYYKSKYGELAKDPAIVSFYERFETINTPFIKAVSEWQSSGGDAKATERVIKLVERHVKALDDVAPLVPRYSSYARRFERTIARVDAGERELVANPRLDSLHNIWFEFHEDVLAVMGRPRTS